MSDQEYIVNEYIVNAGMQLKGLNVHPTVVACINYSN